MYTNTIRYSKNCANHLGTVSAPPPPPPWGGEGGIPLGYPIVLWKVEARQDFSQKIFLFFRAIFLDCRLGCQAKSPGRCQKISEKISAKRLTVHVFQANVTAW